MSTDSPAGPSTTARLLHSTMTTLPNVMTSLTQMSRVLLPGSSNSAAAAAGSSGDAGSANPAGTEVAVKKGPKAEDVRIALFAEFLLKEGFHLVALELHQELMERARGPHNIACLNEFFNDADKVEMALADQAAASRASSTLAGVCRSNGRCCHRGLTTQSLSCCGTACGG